MKSVVFANIGNRDIGLGLKPIYSNPGENIFEKSKWLYEDREKIKNLNAFLLEPVLEGIKRRGDIENIYLFGTLQNPPNRQDTYYIAKIVRDILNAKYGFGEDVIKIMDVESNPSDYDEMYSFYMSIFQTKMFDHINNVCISVTGGAPAQNFSLLLQSLRVYKNKVIVAYVSKGESKARILEIGHELTKSLLIERYDELMQRFLYGVAAEIAERYGLVTSPELKYLRALHHKNNFDFEMALRLLEEAHGYLLPLKNQEADALIKRLQLLTMPGIKQFSIEYFRRDIVRLEELYENMKVKWENGEYADFLGRLYRFQDASLRFLLEREFHINTNDKNEVKCFVEKNPELREFLKVSKIENFLARVAFVKIVEFYENTKPNFSKVARISRRIENLSQIRNGSILGHGFLGVSREIIERKYNEKNKEVSQDITLRKNPLSECERLLNFLKTSVEDNNDE